MTSDQIGDIIYELFVLIIQVAGPLLVVSMCVGVLIAILQAATQIHEQTLTFVPKLLIVGIILVFGGGRMMELLSNFTIRIFGMI